MYIVCMYICLYSIYVCICVCLAETALSWNYSPESEGIEACPPIDL